MKREFLIRIRRSMAWMALFMIGIVFVYLGIVMLGVNVYIYFKGIVPEWNKNVLRLVLYSISAVNIAALYALKRRFFSKEGLKPVAKDLHELQSYLMHRTIYIFTFAEIPAMCGFILFFMGRMFTDFLFLAAVTVLLVLLNIPRLGTLERLLKEAAE